MLINNEFEVRDYEQIKGSRTQAAITDWVRTGHKQTKPKGLDIGIPGFTDALISFSPMSPWWRALYGGLGKAIELHEKGEVPVHIICMVALVPVLTVGSLLIGCCLYASPDAEAAGVVSRADTATSESNSANNNNLQPTKQTLLKYAVD